ncbi:hypothetical protein [Sphingomonas sp. DBB INV C78]|uniref:hypothetical protein n=1 Tax=Sphingomonas sp. DBB INV C78 TaxID=3349434 RepID=UPI0036D3A1D8
MKTTSKQMQALLAKQAKLQSDLRIMQGIADHYNREHLYAFGGRISLCHREIIRRTRMKLALAARIISAWQLASPHERHSEPKPRP